MARPQVIGFRLSSEEHARLAAAAQAGGLTTSAWSRRAVLDQLAAAAGTAAAGAPAAVAASAVPLAAATALAAPAVPPAAVTDPDAPAAPAAPPFLAGAATGAAATATAAVAAAAGDPTAAATAAAAAPAAPSPPAAPAAPAAPPSLVPTAGTAAAAAATEPLSRVVGAKLTPSQYFDLEARAKAAGLPLGTYLRRLIAGRPPTARWPLARAAIVQLAKAGTNLNQLVKLAHQGMPLPAELAISIDSVLGEVRRLRRALAAEPRE
jgi:hypothetical protein